MRRTHSVPVLVALMVCGCAAAPLTENPPTTTSGSIDFRYALPWWQTAICLPDDPDKALVGKEGQLLFDFPGGGVRNFGLCVQPGLAEGAEWQRQETVSARAPIVQTRKDAAGVEVLEETFVVPAVDIRDVPRLSRTDGDQRLAAWAKPDRPCAAAFAGVDVGWNGKPIDLRLAVPAGASVTLVFGLCEGYHQTAGKRPLVLQAEGAAAQTIDPLRDFGFDHPGLVRMAARDVDGDGAIAMAVGTPEGSQDRNAILNALWAFDGVVPNDERILSGAVESYATYTGPSLPARRVVVLVTMANRNPARTTRRPTLSVVSGAPLDLTVRQGWAQAGDGTRIGASEPMESVPGKDPLQGALQLASLELPPGQTRQVAFTIDRHALRGEPPVTVAQAVMLRDAAAKYWTSADLPYTSVQVPDLDVQAMIESCVRNIWQAREQKRGQPAFHVGPTVYRGLWVVDGAFLLECATMLGRGRDARAGVEYLLSHQRPDGSFELLGRYWKENGIVLWIATRHALLTQDREWLRAQWPALQRVVDVIARLRREAATDPAALNHMLLPGGFVDGGIGSNQEPEYSNVYWCLTGLRAAVAAAHWLGDDVHAKAWQAEYHDFEQTLRAAMARDTLRDPHGNAYVPTMMGNAPVYTPQKGQWAFCNGIYPGQIFAADEPLAQSQMAMLRATKTQGMVLDTGWMQDGIWTYFASFYAHAVLWQGRGQEAAEVMYDFAQHASPTRVWREEQMPVGKGGQEVGDMPHNWASAEFLRLVIHLLEIDRGDELHLLEGMPAAWLQPGMRTRLQGVLTPFGPLQLAVEVARDGRSATVAFEALAGNCRAVVVHQPDGATQRLPADRAGRVVVPLGNAGR